MNEEQLSFLETMVATPSVTGCEHLVASLVRERLADVADEIDTDVMGSVHARVRGTGVPNDAALSAQTDGGASGEEAAGVTNEAETAGVANETAAATASDEVTAATASDEAAPRVPSVLIAAHMDEIGLMVNYISDEGFLSVKPVGGVDAGLLPGLRVDVHTDEGALRGVVGRQPIHLVPADERKQVAPFEKLVIDLGMPADMVKQRVQIGDTVTYGVGFERFGDGMAVSRAFDDKAGVFIGIGVACELARGPRAAADFILAATVQEEIGLRGGLTSAYSVDADVCLAFDVTHATDYPGIDKAKHGNIVCGGGPVIARGPNINPVVFNRLVAAAQAEGIDYQIEAEPGITGTDAGEMQIQRGGKACGLVSLPLRYMHTPTEVINLSDVDGCIKLLARFIRDLDADVSFVPGM